MGGYAVVGFLFAIVATGLLVYKTRNILKLPKIRRVRKGLHDAEIKETTIVFSLRDAALISLLYAFSLFFLPLQGMSTVRAGNPEYTALTNISDFAGGMIVAFGVMTCVLQFLKNNSVRQLEKAVRRDSARTKKLRQWSKELFKSRSRS